MTGSVGAAALADQAAALRRWLFDSALPLWWRIGADHINGGYHERIDFRGRPVELPRRSRVAARMAFCYGEAGRLGWRGPWREAGRHALTSLRARFMRDDATVIAAVRPDGGRDETFDLYNQAFALLAYASGHRTLDPEGDWRRHAVTLVDTLRRDFANPRGGFREDRAGTPPFRANPHMHLIEAALAWLMIDGDPIWHRLADEIAALCLERFIDGESGALHELFTADWAPLVGGRGGIVEPGHHYEWAYLLDRWARLTGRERPAAVGKLIAFAEASGVDRARGVVVNGVRLDGSIADAVARLWPQTERLRCYVVDARGGDDPRLGAAVTALRGYLDAPVPGLWYENRAADGTFIVEAAPATSLYHIVGAIAELWTAFG